MNFSSRRIMLSMGVFIAVLVYVAVQSVQAVGPEPGSNQDPLVTKSYVDNYLNSRTQELQGQLAAINRQINTIEAKIAALEGRPAPAPVPAPGPTQPLPSPSPDTEIKLVIDHKTAWLGITARELPVAPYLGPGGVTMVPFRFIGEALGAGVNFDSASRAVSYTTPAHSVILKIGSKQGTVDGRPVTFPAPAILVNGTTMVPVRVISEGLGAQVHWNQPTATVTIRP